MVNQQTSKYVLLNYFFYISCLGIFQYVRDILQNSLPTDHPVDGNFVPPTQNQINLAYLQNQFRIFRKIPSNRRNFFLSTASLHNVSIKKIFQKTNKIVRYIVLDPPRQASQTLDIENSLAYPPLKSVCGRGLLTILLIFLKNSLPTGLLLRGLPADIAARWRQRLFIKNVTSQYDSQFCVSFNFCIDLKAHRSL